MPSIEPGCWRCGDEELRTIGIGAGISHGEKPGLSVLHDEVLIWKTITACQNRAFGLLTLKFLAVDRLAAGTVVPCEITTLQHELRDHTVEAGSPIAKTMLACGEFPKVSCSFRDGFVI
jgi:hypothetical protein